MPIGGVKEKILAAKRNNIKTVYFPIQNKGDLMECADIAEDMNIQWVEHADEVIDKVLLPRIV